MANDLTPSFEDVWARTQQDVFLKRSVSMVVADTSFNSTMRAGDVLKRTYRSVTASDVPGLYTRGTDMDDTDITDVAETLTVNKEYYISFVVDDFDAIQSKYDVAMNYGNDFGIVMQTQMDADVLGEVFNASSTVDDGSIGGTAGNGIALSTSNVLTTVTAVTKKLTKLNIYDTDKVGVVSPEFEEIISQYYGAKVTDLGDDVSQNGYFTKISGYKLFSSNNLAGSASLNVATQPTDGDTVTIQGITFTFKTTLGSTAGNVLIGASAATARTNLIALINAPQTTTAQGVKLSDANIKQFRSRGVTATETGTTVVVKFKGAGVLAVSETLTAGADIWTANLQKQHQLFGIKNKCTTLVVQKKPSVEVERVQKRLSDRIKNGMLYGLKTFADNAKYMVNVEIKSSGF